MIKDNLRQKLFTYMQDAVPFDLSANGQMSIPMILEMIEKLAPGKMSGAMDILGAKPSGPAKTTFHCPLMDQTLRSSCQARTCRNWVDYAPADNCLHAFMTQRQQDTLSLTDISYVTKIKLSSVSRSHALALQQLRQNAVSDIFSFEDLDTEFILRPNKGVCVACESLVGPKESVHTTEHFVWCSKECLDDRVPDEARLEHRYGVRTARLLQFLTYRILGKSNATSIYDAETIQVISHALDMSGSMVERLLRKHNLWQEEAKREARDVQSLLADGDRRTLRRMKKLSALHTDLQRTLNAKYKGAPPIHDAKAAAAEMEKDLGL